MVAVSEGKHQIAFAVGFGKQHSEVVGFTAAKEEECCIEIVPEFFAQFFGILALVGVHVVGGEIE